MSIMALQFQLAAVLLLLSAASTTNTAAAAQAPPRCSDKCGDLTVPYPFGMEEGCYLREEFFINCNRTTQPPAAYLMRGNLIVNKISVDDSELRILNYVGQDCYDEEGDNTYNTPELTLVPPYTISDTKNKFYAVGCDTAAILQGYRGEEGLATGCMSLCNTLDSVDKNDSCSGAGCCQSNIPGGLINTTVTVLSFYNHSSILDFNPCSSAFIAEKGQFNFSAASLKKQDNNYQLRSAVLNWAINDIATCDEAEKRKDFACKNNSKCTTRPTDYVGYLCRCSPGYEGNPYHPDGCKDIDECKASNPCLNGQCKNYPPPRMYSCSCNEGFKNNGTNDKSCIKVDEPKRQSKDHLLIVLLGVCISVLVLFLGISFICWGMKKREIIKLKEKHFKENGGLLLLQRLASHGSSIKTTKIFSAEELEKATNNYHESRVLGEGGFGTVYKGTLPDETEVAIKKSKGGAPTQSDLFVNEVIVLSQINHRNVVKLLGCCLETEVPLLVYEFITRGTLYEHIHKKQSALSFELRMKIATQSAEALSHLHYSISTPIIHRDVKTENILLDDEYTAKVSDFGASRLVPSGQSDIQTLVLGTFGYLDPEYLQLNQFTEKSDVYSFGVVLVELLTSKVPVSKNRCLSSIFLASMEEGWLDQILDDDIVNEGNIETVKKVANLAKRCLMVKGKERPTMKQVAMELEGMRITAKHPWRTNVNFCPDENEYLLGELDSNAHVLDVTGGDGSSSGLTSGTTNAYDSMQIQLPLMPYGGGR